MESLSTEIQRLLTKIAENNGISNFRVGLSKSVSEEGDGYIGILEAVCIKDKDSNKKLNLVLKRAPASEKLRQFFPTRPAFLREIVMYEDIFPELTTFQKKYDIPHPFNSVTDSFGSITDEFKEVVVLTNLKAEGFRLCNRREPLDVHHLSRVLITYARLHAVSLAMRRLEPERFEMIKAKIGENVMQAFKASNLASANTDITKEEIAATMTESMLAPTLEVIKDNPRLLERVNTFKKGMLDFFFVTMQELDESEFTVVSHSDCWCANLLFKYEDEFSPNIPTKIKLIDWQMSSVTHFMHDLSYFFCISAGKSDLSNYKRYLNVYHTALCENLTAFGLEPHSFISWEVLEEQWKKYCKLGFFMCLVMLQQSLSETKTHDFEKLAEKGEELFDFKTRRLNISDRFKQRMSDLVEFFVDKDFL